MDLQRITVILDGEVGLAGQRHHGDLGMVDESVPGRRAAPGHDIHHAFREDIGDDLGELHLLAVEFLDQRRGGASRGFRSP